MSCCIFVGGPAASGKTTVINQLLKSVPSFYYRPSQAFFDIAHEKNITHDDVFNIANMDEAEALFIKVCMSHELVIGDVHYAIQPVRDSFFASGTKVQDISEKYVASISSNLINSLSCNNIRILSILLYADPKILFKRAFDRQQSGCQQLRAFSLDDVKTEVNAEIEQWKILSSFSQIRSLSFDTGNCDQNKITEDICKFL
jgi:hypothetical protein